MRVLLHYSKDELTCDGEDMLVVVYAFFKQLREQTHHQSLLTHCISYFPDNLKYSAFLQWLKEAFCSGFTDATTWSRIACRSSPYITQEKDVARSIKALDNLSIPPNSPEKLKEPNNDDRDKKLALKTSVG